MEAPIGIGVRCRIVVLWSRLRTGAVRALARRSLVYRSSPQRGLPVDAPVSQSSSIGALRSLLVLPGGCMCVYFYHVSMLHATTDLHTGDLGRESKRNQKRNKQTKRNETNHRNKRLLCPLQYALRIIGIRSIVITIHRCLPLTSRLIHTCWCSTIVYEGPPGPGGSRRQNGLVGAANFCTAM